MLRLYYLSGAPRVSTRANSMTPGPRSHILGITGAARRTFDVQMLVAGDTAIARRYLQGEGTEGAGVAGARAQIRDAVRLAWRYIFAALALANRPSGPIVTYERFGLLQDATALLRPRPLLEIVESNGVFFREAAADRRNLAWRALARRLEIRKYKKADILVVVSRQLAQELSTLDAALAEKIVVVPNGVDTSFFCPAATSAATRDRVAIGWVGTMLAWQGLAELVEACAEPGLRDRIEMHLVGDGPERPEIERLTRALNVRACFHGPLPRPEVVKVLQRVDLAYSGHRDLAEGRKMYHSPLKLYEYASVGLPIIASDSDDARSLLSRVGMERLIFNPALRGDLRRALFAGLAGVASGDLATAALRDCIVHDHSWDSRWSLIEQKIRELLP